MTVSLVLPQAIAEELQAAAAHSVETAGVMLASIAQAPSGDLRILARHMRWVAESSYSHREWNGLAIRSEGYVHSLAEAEKLKAACIWVHTHPGEEALPERSEHDRIVDREISGPFRLRSGNPYYGALIFSPRSPGLAFTGHLHREGCDSVTVERFWQVGDRWRLPARSIPLCRRCRRFSTAM